MQYLNPRLQCSRWRFSLARYLRQRSSLHVHYRQGFRHITYEMLPKSSNKLFHLINHWFELFNTIIYIVLIKTRAIKNLTFKWILLKPAWFSCLINKKLKLSDVYIEHCTWQYAYQYCTICEYLQKLFSSYSIWVDLSLFPILLFKMFTFFIQSTCYIFAHMHH